MKYYVHVIHIIMLFIACCHVVAKCCILKLQYAYEWYMLYIRFIITEHEAQQRGDYKSDIARAGGL